MANTNNKSKETVVSRYDIKIIFPVILLTGLGIIMVYSSSSAMALKKFSGEYFFLKKQILCAMIGLATMFFCARFPYKYYQILAYPLLCLSIFLLIMVKFTALGYSAGGSQRWLYFAGYSFQPSELARFAMIIFLAYSLHKKQDKVKNFSIGFLPHIILLIILTSLIIIQPDFGATAILWALTWIMLFIGGVRLLYLSSSLMIIIPAGCCFIFYSGYRIKRILSFLDPWAHMQDGGYQIVQSLIAFGSGGIWGVGIGKGLQKLFYLPESHTDFIFSIIGEELGLCGVLIIIILYGFILWKGIIISNNAPDLFGSLLAMGITAAIGLQVLINMGVALGMLPTKGLTLPLISYGGTSLLFSMASIGILMNIGATKK